MLLSKIKTAINRFIEEEDGATMVEYALLVALISIAAIAAITHVGKNLTTLFQNVASKISTT